MNRWPAMMRRKTLAEYCDISEAEVERRVAAGELPQPISFGGKDRWYRQAVSDRLAELSGEGDAEWRRKLHDKAA